MRKLHLERIRRRLASEHSELIRVGLPSSFQSDAPWDLAFREAARDEHFWSTEVDKKVLQYCTAQMTRNQLMDPAFGAIRYANQGGKRARDDGSSDGPPAKRTSGTRRRGTPRTATSARTLEEEEEEERQGQRRARYRAQESFIETRIGSSFVGRGTNRKTLRRTLSAQQVSLVRVVPGTTQDHSLYKSWTRLTSCEGDRSSGSGGEEGREDRGRHGGEAHGGRQRGGASRRRQAGAHDQYGVCLGGSSAGGCHRERAGHHGRSRVYEGRLLAECYRGTVASSRSGLAAKTLMLAELQPHQVAHRRQPVSNKHARRLEDDVAVGGTRNPATAILKLPGGSELGPSSNRPQRTTLCARPGVVASVVKSIQEVEVPHHR